MAIEFPSSPVDGETYTFNGRTWQWTGDAWRRFTNQGQVVSVLTRFGPLVQSSVEALPTADITFLHYTYV